MWMQLVADGYVTLADVSPWYNAAEVLRAIMLEFSLYLVHVVYIWYNAAEVHDALTGPPLPCSLLLLLALPPSAQTPHRRGFAARRGCPRATVVLIAQSCAPTVPQADAGSSGPSGSGKGRKRSATAGGPAGKRQKRGDGDAAAEKAAEEAEEAQQPSARLSHC